MKEQAQPNGPLTLMVPAMPRDTNASGDIFGGWLMSQMDLAAAQRATAVSGCRVVTAVVKEMSFERPVKVGDVLAIHTSDVRIGNTSIKMRVEAWAIRYVTHEMELVTHAEFIMVAIDENGKPTPIKKDDKA